MFLHDDDVAAWLNALTDKEFVEFFYKHLASRRIAAEEFPHVDNHLALAEVRRIPDYNGALRPPMVELLAASPRPSKPDDPIAFRGTCCGFQTGGYRRYATCPVCGNEVKDA